MPIRFRLCLVTAFVLLTSMLSAQEQEYGVILLPDEGYSQEFQNIILKAQQENANSPRWKEFREKYGSWQAVWNPYTAVPYRVWGEGIQIAGYSAIDSANAASAARAFLAHVADLLRCDPTQLHALDANEYQGKWTVSFDQEYNGIPVLYSDVTVSMTSSGRVFLFGSDAYPEIGIDPNPGITVDKAIMFAANGLTLPNGALGNAQGGALAVLPYKSVNGLVFRLVYSVVIPEDTEHIWETLVDAGNGQILRRINRVRDGIGGQVSSSVKTSSYTTPATTVGNPYQYVTVNGNTTITDSAGYWSNTSSGQTTFKFEGPYCKVSRQDAASAAITVSIPNNQTYNITWTDANSAPAERTTFYNVNRGRSYIVGMDPGITSLNSQVLAKVNLPQLCNANFDGTGLNFYTSGSSPSGTCVKAGEMPDVILHEYGHLVNDRVYKQFGATAGMTNASLHEGIADANASMILDRSEMGVGFFGANTVLRNLDNTNSYPRDITGESHTDGLIIGGACWDMRQAIGNSLSGHHIHFARRGKPDDANTGKAFTKYFLEILKADDNDGNLANGTPNSSSIVSAFAKHGIPSGMLTIAHTKVSSASPNTSIPISCDVTTALAEITTHDVTVYYRNYGTSTWSSSGLSKISGSVSATSTWSGSIPGQNGGTILEYYLEATEGWGSSIDAPVDGPAAAYKILIGFTQRAFYDFESNGGWQGGVPGDQANTGKWIDADPVGTWVNGMPVQPEDDHSASGAKCWVTANGSVGGQPGDADVDNGETTLLSPQLSLQNLTTPVIRYWRWFSNDLGAAPGGDPWVVQISSDNGATWTDVEHTTTSFNHWEENIVPVSSYITPTDQVRMRFIARDDDPQSLVEAAVDDFEILSAQTTPVEITSLSASRRGTAIDVRWQTASETNNSGFTIEFRPDGAAGDWVAAGYVPGNGTSYLQHDYAFSFDDRAGRPVVLRLRQIDTDGSFHLSPEIRLPAEATGFTLRQNYPNPFNPSTVVGFDLDEQSPCTIIIRTVLGREVLRRSLGLLDAGTHDVLLTLDGLPSGCYVYSLQSGTRQISRTLVLRK